MFRHPPDIFALRLPIHRSKALDLQEGSLTVKDRIPRWSLLLRGFDGRLGNRVQVADAAYENDSVGNRWSRHQHFAHGILRQQLVFRPGPHYEDVAIFAAK